MQPSVATRTAFSHALLVLLVLWTLQAAHGQGSSQVRASLPVPDLFEALRRARTQDAFVFWNHPEAGVPKLEWFTPIAAAHQEKLFRGMELINGMSFYASAYPWIEEKKLTILCNSDIHDPMPPRAAEGIRPITLLFVHTADVAGVREALFARRTAAWMGGQVWGAEQFLRGLWQGAVRVENPGLSYRPGTPLVLRVHNNSAIPFHFRIRQAPAWFRIETNVIAAEGTSLLFPHITSEAPEGSQHLELELELTNLHIGAGRKLVVRVPLTANVSRQ